MAKKSTTDSKKSTKSAAKKPAASKAPKKKEIAVEAKSETAKETSKKKAPSAPRRPLQEKTFFAEAGKHNTRWQLYDASEQPLGRLSSLIAKALMGKDTPAYTRYTDSGANVVVVNAEKVVLTGKKWENKTYHYHTNFPGGIKTFTARNLRDKNPERVIERAVYGMLPKGHMGRKWYKKLHVYAGNQHPHIAQKPVAVTLPNQNQERA